ncbi:MAG: SDR family NAD(P)-dependent oxidoreductase, partial [Bdellovibrionota bacterium]
ILGDFMRINLENCKAIVTGGSRGLGRSIVLELAKCGAQVVFTYSNNDQEADKTVQMVRDLTGQKVIAIKASATDRMGLLESVKKLMQEWKSVDVLINNAGVSEFLPLALMEEAEWDRTLDTNLKGVYLTTKAVIQHMIRNRQGHILNIGSLAGARLLAAPIDYCSSKAGVIGFTEALAKEVGRYQIKVNCLAPGILDGGVAKGIPENKYVEFMEQISLHRPGTFDEVARFVAFLVSSKNSYMSGATIIMDGGL